MAEKIRIQKYLADCGVLSRRAAEAEIAAGHVKLNGSIAPIGAKLEPGVDTVELNGRVIRPRADKPHRYVLLNKPRGIVCTAHDEKGRRNVTELVRIPDTRLYPVGRLDMDSEGLLLLTDDGELTCRLTHPRHEIPKIYRVETATPPTDEQLAALGEPMTLDGYRILPVKLRRCGERMTEWRLYEGRNRQIRRMCEAVGLKVTRLCRIAIGSLQLGELAPGAWRELTPQEVAYLYGDPSPKTERKL